MLKITRLALRFALALVGAVVLAGCPSSDPAEPDPATLALALSPTSGTVQQGGSTTFVATATAGGAFSGSPTLSVSGVPTGVTGSVSGVTTTGATTTGTVTIQAAASTTPGSYDLMVRAQGSSAPDATAPFALTVTAAPNYALSLSPAALSIAQGASGTSTVTITQTNFTGAVTLGLGGAPTGVTGSFVPAAPTGTTSTLTVTVAGSVAPGTYNLTVDGSGTPGNRSTALSLTVTATPNYALSLSPPALSIAQGANGTSSVTITRTNFTGAVTLGLGGAPTGVTGSFVPAAPTGTSSTLTVAVAGSVAPGTYNLTVDGSGAPGGRSTPLALTVTGGGGPTQVTISFAACPTETRPVWFAYQDGSGAWARVTGVSNAYTFNLSSAVGGIAFVNDYGVDGTEISVRYMTAAELAAQTTPLCYIEPTTNHFYTGTLAGVAAGEIAYVAMGGFGTPGLTTGSPLQFGVPSGTHDLVGFRSSLTGAATARGLFRRDVVITGPGTFGTVDFAGSESFAAASATITIGGLTGGEVLVQNTFYDTGAMCRPAILNSGVLAGASFTAYGMPSAQQRTTDYHRVMIFAHSDGSSNPIASRSVTESFNLLAARTITVGASIPTPTLTTLTGPYKRLQAVYTLPADYQATTSFSYEQVSIFATLLYFGGTNVTLGMPDFSSLAGWNNAWAPAMGGSSGWRVAASGGTAGSLCTENARALTAYRQGTF